MSQDLYYIQNQPVAAISQFPHFDSILHPSAMLSQNALIYMASMDENYIDASNNRTVPKPIRRRNRSSKNPDTKRKPALKKRPNVSCLWCHTTETTEWRRGPSQQFLCNPCGLQYAKRKKDVPELPALPARGYYEPPNHGMPQLNLPVHDGSASPQANSSSEERSPSPNRIAIANLLN